MKIKGFKFSGISANIKKNGRKDLGLICGEGPLSVAGVFTSSSIKAAPVVLDIERIKGGSARAVIVNSGNANACTGEAGMRDAIATSSFLAAELGALEEEVLVSSTGVIGQRLPVEKINAAIPELVAALDYDNVQDFAEAIMTTDSYPKMHSVTSKINGKDVSITGVAKGAGMISPNMATMLSYVMTDAAINSKMLAHALKVATDVSFNSITVDGDMSTNDTVIALASGASGADIVEGETGHLEFISMLKELMIELAKMIVRDGEGATKLIELKVKGADSKEDAKKAAVKIANSPLVKTAFYGEDANWGRIVAALGGTDIKLDEAKLDIWFDDVCIVKDGLFKGVEAEEEATERMKNKEISLTVNINMGPHEATLWTCDLTHDYIKINAEYRS
ncbi:MAG: bifunctional glutamate N-acetyltransferase/amino-acid acetyltransferase ArgJ [bacterium]|nr:bifunctional glutamate N-acetyltransferase/amino-acid acetyltransferase ArgJ [bacterium]